MTGVPFPLASIERAVLHRAKQVTLDLSAHDAAGQLRGLIGDEVAQWSLAPQHACVRTTCPIPPLQSGR